MGLQQKTAKTVPTRIACEMLDVNRNVLARMIELGYFTMKRANPLLRSGPYRIMADEIKEYQRLDGMGLPQKRILSGMQDFRARLGRK